MTRERKTFEAIITEADEEQGIVKAIFAVTGNIDQGNDRIKSGAFAKTITERGHKVRVLDNHNTNSVNDAIAKTIALREVGRVELPAKTLEAFPNATGGAEITAQFMLDDDRSAAAFKRIKGGLVTEWSFAYDAFDTSHVEETKDNQKIIVRNIGTIKLYEVSPVIFGMNEATSTTLVKEKDKPKAGRAISARNEARMRSIIDSVQAQLEQLESILPSAQVEQESEPEGASAGTEPQKKETHQHDSEAGPGESPPTDAQPPLVDIDQYLKQTFEEVQ